jgi:hypothetical protein
MGNLPTSPTTSRRTLMAGTAWAVPTVVVAAAAPAMASSACVPTSVTTDWASSAYHWSSQKLATYTGTNGNNITLTTVEYGDERVGDPTTNPPTVTNLTIHPGSSTLGSAVWIEMTEVNPDGTAKKTGRQGIIGNRIEVTVTFDTAVTGLTFSLGDIDQSNDFTDAVALSAVGGTLSGTKVDSTYLIGSGTTGSPWTPTLANGTVSGALSDASNRGNVTVTSTGSITSFTIIYWNRHTADGTDTTRQRIYLGNLTYTQCV